MKRVVGEFLAALCGDFLGGFFIGVVHAAMLAAAGLYISESGQLFAFSLLRYFVLFALISATVGGVIHLLAILMRRRAGGMLGSPVLFGCYVTLWAAILFREGQRGSAMAHVGAALLLLTALLMAWRVLRLFFVGTRHVLPSRFAIFVAVLLMLATPWLVFRPMPQEDAPASTPSASLAEQLTARPNARARNVLLLTVDTLRADHLGCYGYPRNTSPGIDSLATKGTLFTRAYCQRPKTSPSFATIHTGNYPVAHGIHAPKQLLHADNLTLAEMLAEAGYRTGASVTNGNLYPEFGFDQGFEDYFHGHKDARSGARLAREWLDKHGTAEEPWFLWVHFTDPHAPYEPDPPFDSMFDTGATEEPAASTDRYDGEIRYTDAQSRWLLAWLHEHPAIRDETIVLFTADHGESLGEHDYWFEHGLHPYEPSARIPLIFSAPGLIPASPRRDQLIGAVDFLPTLLDLLGLPLPQPVQGRSFAPLLLGESGDAPREYVFLEAGYGEHIGPGRTRALLRGDGKYVHRLRSWAQWPRTPREFVSTVDAWFEGSLASDELYRLNEDPAEERNLLRALPRLARQEREALRSVAERIVTEARASIELNPDILDPETVESLRALGYIE